MSLPLPTDRINPQRKARIVNALLDGTWTAEELREKYSMSPEELDTWVAQYQLHGRDGLSVTKAQRFRSGVSINRYGDRGERRYL